MMQEHKSFLIRDLLGDVLADHVQGKIIINSTDNDFFFLGKFVKCEVRLDRRNPASSIVIPVNNQPSQSFICFFFSTFIQVHMPGRNKKKKKKWEKSRAPGWGVSRYCTNPCGAIPLFHWL